MKILVSACLLGVKCKYNGGDNRNEAVIRYCHDKEIIAMCPEMEAGMPCPRIPVEIVKGKVTDRNGKDMDRVYRRGVDSVMARIKADPPVRAILKAKSPTCGVHEIYDGTFTGVRIPGQGILTEALGKEGIPVVDEKDIEREEKEQSHHGDRRD